MEEQRPSQAGPWWPARHPPRPQGQTENPLHGLMVSPAWQHPARSSGPGRPPGRSREPAPACSAARQQGILPGVWCGIFWFLCTCEPEDCPLRSPGKQGFCIFSNWLAHCVFKSGRLFPGPGLRLSEGEVSLADVSLAPANKNPPAVKARAPHTGSRVMRSAFSMPSLQDPFHIMMGPEA